MGSWCRECQAEVRMASSVGSPHPLSSSSCSWTMGDTPGAGREQEYLEEREKSPTDTVVPTLPSTLHSCFLTTGAPGPVGKCSGRGGSRDLTLPLPLHPVQPLSRALGLPYPWVSWGQQQWSSRLFCSLPNPGCPLQPESRHWKGRPACCHYP